MIVILKDGLLLLEFLKEGINDLQCITVDNIL